MLELETNFEVEFGLGTNFEVIFGLDTNFWGYVYTFSFPQVK